MPACPALSRLAFAATVSIAALGLAACGGRPTSSPLQTPSEPATDTAAADQQVHAATATIETRSPQPAPASTRTIAADTSRAAAQVAPLFDDDGRPASTAFLLPARPVRTLAGLYASAAQLEWQELVAGPNTVVLDLDHLGGELAAEHLAQQVLAFRPSADLAWFVKGSDGAASVRTADRLTAQGVAPVFLVP